MSRNKLENETEPHTGRIIQSPLQESEGIYWDYKNQSMRDTIRAAEEEIPRGHIRCLPGQKRVTRYRPEL